MAIVWASSTGCRSAASSTAVPNRTRCVRAATAAKVTNGSNRGLAVRLSPTHTESRPATLDLLGQAEYQVGAARRRFSH